MREDPDFRPVAYALITVGSALAFVTAVVPHYSAGHRLLLDVLLIGLLPYVVYAFFTEQVRGWPLLAAGVLTLVVDLAVKIPERFLYYDGYQSGLVYRWPLAASLVMLPLLLGTAAWCRARRTKPN